MIITSVVNTHNLTQIQNKREKIFFLVMRTLRIYSLNNFHIQHTTVLIVFIMLYFTSLVLIYLIIGSLYLLTTFLQFLLPSPPPQPLGATNLLYFSLNFFPHISEVIYTVFVCLTHFT